MPGFIDHIKQAKHNLSFLESINEKLPLYTDWQVTACFYSALHLVNAHLSKFDLQYRSHNDVKNALNPAQQLSVAKLPENEYVAYVSLQMLSRRSRYLVNEKGKNLLSEVPHFTYDKHLAKSLRHLDILLKFFNKAYQIEIKPIKVSCAELDHSNPLLFVKNPG